MGTTDTTPLAERQRRLADVSASRRVPVLVVGGGIIGAGLVRDLALQGVPSLLVERGDFGCGATAGPSRMIHGGLRYLEHGDFRLVKESVTERNLLLTTAPHVVFPLPTTVPITSWFTGLGSILCKMARIPAKRPSSRGAAVVKAGLMLYDFLGRETRVMPKHHFAMRSTALARRPGLRPDVIGTATYYDAWISYPERLVLELLLDAEAACADTRALNYTSLTGGSGTTVTLRDELTGDTFEVEPDLVINATGAWIDTTNGCLGCETDLVGGTKGGHLILEHPELVEALGDEMVLYETPDGRVCISFVWQGKALIGSTDIRIEDPDEARCDDSEIDYILNAIRTPFPDIKVGREHIISTFSGVRPLAASTASTTGAVSRSHRCDVTEPSGAFRVPIYSMIGGKWTPFRAFAEQVTTKILAERGTERTVDTRRIAIGGGRDYPSGPDSRQAWISRMKDTYGLSEDRVETLLWRYGTRAADVAAFMAQGPDEPLQKHPGYSRREIEFIVRVERVWRLDDLVLRRTSMALLGDVSAALLNELGTLMQTILGGSDDARREDIKRTSRLLKDQHGITLT